MSVKLSDILDLKLVKIKNPEDVERKLNKLIEGGRSKLQYVMDFDGTLTKHKSKNGERVMDSGEILARCTHTRPDIHGKCVNVVKDIYKMNDSNASYEEKDQSSIVKYLTLIDLLRNFKLPWDEVDSLSKTVSENFRDGIDDFLNMIKIENIPLLLISAGSGNVIVEILKYKNYHTSNVKIVATFLEVNDDGVIICGKIPYVHMFNKNQPTNITGDVRDLIKSRTNVILAGDSLTDSNMSDALDDVETVLKIGYYSNEQKENLSLYIDAFDIVLIEDESFDVFNNILKYI